MATDAQEAAAALTQSVLTEMAVNGDENAARLLAQAAPASAVEAPAVVSTPASTEPALFSVPEPDVGPPEEATVVEVPSFDPVPDDELDRLLEEPDFDEDARQEVSDLIEQGSVSLDDADAAARLRALEKRNEWLEGRLVTSERKKWVEENLRKYPLLATYAADDVAAIDATSRRAFARAAAALQERYSRALEPALADIARMKDSLKAEADKNARLEAAQAWGTPIAEPSGGATPQTEINAALARARADGASDAERFKILAGIIPAKYKGGT